MCVCIYNAYLFILRWFQAYNLVVRQSRTLPSVPLDISSTHPFLNGAQEYFKS